MSSSLQLSPRDLQQNSTGLSTAALNHSDHLSKQIISSLRQDVEWYRSRLFETENVVLTSNNVSGEGSAGSGHVVEWIDGYRHRVSSLERRLQALEETCMHQQQSLLMASFQSAGGTETLSAGGHHLFETPRSNQPISQAHSPQSRPISTQNSPIGAMKKSQQEGVETKAEQQVALHPSHPTHPEGLNTATDETMMLMVEKYEKLKMKYHRLKDKYITATDELNFRLQDEGLQFLQRQKLLLRLGRNVRVAIRFAPHGVTKSVSHFGSHASALRGIDEAYTRHVPSVYSKHELCAGYLEALRGGVPCTLIVHGNAGSGHSFMAHEMAEHIHSQMLPLCFNGQFDVDVFVCSEDEVRTEKIVCESMSDAVMTSAFQMRKNRNTETLVISVKYTLAPTVASSIHKDQNTAQTHVDSQAKTPRGTNENNSPNNTTTTSTLTVQQSPSSTLFTLVDLSPLDSIRKQTSFLSIIASAGRVPAYGLASATSADDVQFESIDAVSRVLLPILGRVFTFTLFLEVIPADQSDREETECSLAFAKLVRDVGNTFHYGKQRLERQLMDCMKGGVSPTK